MNIKFPSNFSPLLNDLRRYQLSWLPRDLFAGLSVAAVQVPTAVAYSQLAGFSPEVGLYASILPVIMYAFLGSSRQLVIGPDAATTTMVASLVAPMAHGDPVQYVTMTAALSLMSGLLMIVGGLARMGFIVNFFARPILIGFLNGVAASIIVGQLGKLLGVAVNHRDFIPSLIELSTKVTAANWMTLAVGACTLLMLVLLKRFAPRAPGSLIALAIASCGLLYFGGTAASQVALVGAVPSGLPHLAVPVVSYNNLQNLLVSALGLVVVSFTSGMLTCRSFAARTGQSINSNQEMFALGVANVAAGFSGGFAVTGGDSRTAVNVANNSKTQLSSVIAAIATAVVAACLSAPLGYLPLSALAAVLIFSATHLLDFSSYKELREVDPFEFRLSLLTTAAVLTLGVLSGVAIAITLALIIVLIKIYKPEDTILGKVPGLDGFNDIALSPQSCTIPGIVIWRFEGPLVFFNAEYFKVRMRQIILQTSPPPHWFVLSLESISQTDATGIKALEELLTEMQAQGIHLVLARPKPYMRRFRDNTELGIKLTAQNIYPTIAAAVDAILLRETVGTEKLPRPTGSYQSFYQLRDSAAQHPVERQ